MYVLMLKGLKGCNKAINIVDLFLEKEEVKLKA
jgi:hypothetical protein